MTTSQIPMQTPPPLYAGSPPSSAERFSGLLGTMGPIAGLLFVFVIFAILEPRTFLTMDNMQIVLLNTAVVGTAALGATVIIIAGGIDLSVGANIALCTVVIALCRLHGLAPMLAVLVGIAASASVGLVIGLLVTQCNLSSFIITLGLWGAVRGVAKRLAGGSEISTPPSWISHLLQMLPPGRKWMIVPPGVWLLLILSLFVTLVLRYTRFGRHVFAIGSNEHTARLCGVPITRTKLLIFVFATIFAGIAGVLQFSYLNNLGDPTTANGYELNVIAAVVIGGASLSGGRGNIFGTLIGALLMTMVANGCNKVPSLTNADQDIVTGVIIVAAAGFDQFRQSRGTAK
ncbi:MAG TPA: ABC transporter permease [Tepidisphaeraceae bacterium]|jgi:ribose/xylose/arabinose/galactoside ABC-type transport system permease subunit|nr:ABC transporter permease [Tepidisphaeraceae bacterium]